MELRLFELPESDLDFVVDTAAPDFEDKRKLKELIREDPAFRKGLVGNEKVFSKVMTEEGIEVRISPQLFFEILLRRAQRELEKIGYTAEWAGSQRVPVFDTEKVIGFLDKEMVVEYLAGLLTSFTKIESFTLRIRVKSKVWRKVTFSEMDIDSLKMLCQRVDEQFRFSFYQRIAEVCLFIVGVFPEYLQFKSSYLPGKPFREIMSKKRKPAEKYEEEGRKFYQLASKHKKAKSTGFAEVFSQLSENFNLARKPLDFVSYQYLRLRKSEWFDIQ